MAHIRQELTLEAICFEELEIDACKFIDAGVEFFVDHFKLMLRGSQMAQHAVE